MKYRKPPVVERALAIHCEIPEEVYELKLGDWKEIVKRAFPDVENVTEFSLGIGEKDGMPFLDPARQTITIRQRFWHKDGDKRIEGIQLWSDKIVFNLMGEPGAPRDYEDLDHLRERWLPNWADHFQVTHFSGVTLEYVNLLSAQTLPQFVKGSTLRIGDVVQIFDTVPGRLKNLVPPLEFNLAVDGQTQPPSLFRSICYALPTTADVPPVIHLRFSATTHMDAKRKEPLVKARPECELMHKLIISQFEEYFTMTAKTSFEPL